MEVRYVVVEERDWIRTTLLNGGWDTENLPGFSVKNYIIIRITVPFSKDEHAGSGMKTGISSLTVIDMLLVLVVVIWGLNFTIVKIALLEMNPLVFNCFRAIVASVFLIILSCFKKSNRPNRGNFLQLFALGLIGNGIYQELFILGIYRTAAGVTALIMAATPIFVMIIDSVLHVEKIGHREWIGVIFSFIGIILMIHIGAL